MPPWRLANALITLRNQINAQFPARSKTADGALGDAAHQSRYSDHNPDTNGVVRALDLTHDPAAGFNTWLWADTLRTSRDTRISYVISNKRIFSSSNSPWAWRPYTLGNPHSHHIHISVTKPLQDLDLPWTMPSSPTTAPSPPDPFPTSRPILKLYSHGPLVRNLQAALNISPDGLFGPSTLNAVRILQHINNLHVDGIVGPLTWTLIDLIAELD